jgi:putative Mg2+ transporter-C (MgtC) family protein
MHWWTFAANIGAAALMGGAIGLERQWRQHTAGLRTNALVALGAALFVSLSFLLNQESDRTRIAAQVVSGLGFLGGGVILREGFNVRGMNTAATIWCSGAVGTLAGSGLLLEGALGTAAILVLHLVMRPVVRIINDRVQALGIAETFYHVRVTCQRRDEGLIRMILLRHVNSKPHLALQGLSTQDTDDGQHVVVTAEVYAAEHSDRFMEEIVARISIEQGVTAVSWEKTSR